MTSREVRPGTRAAVRIGSRLATVTVLHQSPRGGWVCRTDDTKREVVASPARLRPLPGSPEEAAAAARDEARRLSRLRRDNRAAEARKAAELEVYGRAGLEFFVAWSAEGLRDHAEQWLERLPSPLAAAAARAAILRALDSNPSLATTASWDQIVQAGTQCSAGQPLETGAPVPWILRSVGPRPIERPAGANRSILAGIVARRHVGSSLLSVARAVWRSMPAGGLRTAPVPLRRGVWQAVAEMHAGNRATYRLVMGHDAPPSPGRVADAVGVACGLGPCPR